MRALVYETRGWGFESLSEHHFSGGNSVVESQSSKLLVVGSIPILRSTFALVVQLVEALVLETRCWGFESLQAHQ